MTRCRAFLPGLMVLLFSLPAAACLWDYDTLRDERRGLPGIAEVLAGRWEKHSQFFYENRVVRMNALIAKEPANWPAYDNLAVALEKLGRIDDAIEIMLRKEKQNPAQYTTYANLGTFHLHKGELDAGIDYIRKALAINPNAHFGREAYQLQLAEFLRDGQKNPQLVMSMNFLHIVHSNKVAPALYAALTQPATSPSTTQPGDYVSPIWAARGSPNAVAYALGRNDAFEGIVGIIRFGTGKSAELYLTLGDLLVLRGDKNLAYRAYQRAADLGHPRQEYLHASMAEVKGFIGNDVPTEAIIAAERAEADAWVQAYQQFEDDLIRAGKDPDDEANLAPFYTANGSAIVPVKFELSDVLPREPAARGMIYFQIVGGVGLVVVALYVGRRIWRRRKRRKLPRAA